MKKLLILLSFIALTINSFSQIGMNFDLYCKDIQVTQDEFSGEKKYQTPLERSVSFRMLSNGSKRVMYMNITTVAEAKITGKGVTVSFDRGYSIRKEIPTKVYENENGLFVHYVEFKLNKDDISILKNYNMVGYSLYTYNSVVQDFLQFRAYVNCLSKVQ